MQKKEINIPYHVNPAVIKGHLSRLTKTEFIKQAIYIKQKAMELPCGNKRRMYVELYKWCKYHYINTF